MSTLDDIAKRAQACFSAKPAIVLGSGASAAFGLATMKELADYLVENVAPEGEKATDAWLLVRTALSQGDHLEEALADKHLDKALVDQIVKQTWLMMAKGEETVFSKALSSNFHHYIGDC